MDQLVPAGNATWFWFVGITGIISAVRPFLRISDRVKTYTKLWTGYSDLVLSYEHAVREIQAQQDLTPAVEKELEQAGQRVRTLASDEDPRPKRRLMDRCEREVLKELPQASFWTP